MNDALVGGNVNAAVFLCRGQAEDVVVLVDRAADGAEAVVAVRQRDVYKRQALVLPGALDVVHDVVRAAEAGDTGADAGGKVLVLCDVDTGSVSRGGIFADGAQAQARAGLRQEEPDRNRCV